MNAQEKNVMPSVATVDTAQLRDHLVTYWLSDPSTRDIVVKHLIAHIDAHVAAQVAAKDAEIARMIDKIDELHKRVADARAAQAAAQVSALADVVKYTRLARGIQNPAGDHRNGPWEDFYACDDVVRALAASQPSPAPVAMTEPQGWRDFIENIATPCSEPLNSVCVYRDKESRAVKMGELRAKARAILAAQQESV